MRDARVLEVFNALEQTIEVSYRDETVKQVHEVVSFDTDRQHVLVLSLDEAYGVQDALYITRGKKGFSINYVMKVPDPSIGTLSLSSIQD